MRRWTRLLPLTIAVAAVAAVASAQPQSPGRGPGGPGMRPGPPLERLLGLSADQQTKVRALREAEREQVQPIAETARPHHEALRALLDDDQPSAEAVGQQVIEINRIQKQIKAVRDSFHQQFIALLTTEQQEALEKLEEQRPGRGHDGPAGPDGPPFGRFPGPRTTPR